MSSQALAEDLLRFIHTSIPSVPYLEALLLIRSEPEESWNTELVANRLYLSVTAARELLAELCASGVAVEAQGAYRFRPQSTELSGIIDRLAEAYSHNLLDVTRMIHSGTGKKAQIFADAFKWRKEP
jgi:hypothetical protein